MVYEDLIFRRVEIIIGVYKNVLKTVKLNFIIFLFKNIKGFIIIKF